MAVNQIQRRTGLNQTLYGMQSSKLRTVDGTDILSELGQDQMNRSSQKDDQMNFASFLHQNQLDETENDTLSHQNEQENIMNAMSIHQHYNVSDLKTSDTYTSNLQNTANVAYDKSPVNYVRPGDYFSKANENGIIAYNGVNIVCDPDKSALCIGDVTEGQDVFSVNLCGGLKLKVNRKNMDDIPRVIGMFTPEDQKRIVNAILADKQLQKVKNEMADEALKISK